MSNQDGQGPAEMARHRLLTLIRFSSEAVPDFDPWEVAAADRLLDEAKAIDWDGTGAPPPCLSEWSIVHAAFEAAEEAWAGSILRSPMLQVEAARHCLSLKSDVDAGDGSAVLEVAANCATHGLIMPTWAAVALVQSYQAVALGECRSWSDEKAFGAALPKGSNIAGVRAQVKDAPWAYEVAVHLLEEDPSRPLDQGFYEQVGATIKRGHSTVQALIAGYVKRSNGLHPPLADVRSGLQSGLDLSAVNRAWSNAQHDAALLSIGWQPGADGIWRNTLR